MSRLKRQLFDRTDRLLWHRVTRTITPLDRRRHPAGEELPDLEAGPQALATKMPLKPAFTEPVVRSVANRAAVLDKPTWRKIARGRVRIDARIDLHTLNQREAHQRLLTFVHQAFNRGQRHILVITGKGASHGSEGVLRRVVPIWLSTAPFRPMVSGYHDAARHHGGTGAIYLRLRRTNGNAEL